MAYGYGKTGILKLRFNIYLRAQASYTAPTDLSGITTLLATGTQIGELEDKSVKVTLVPGDTVELNDGSTKVLEYVGAIELKDLNLTAANIAQLISTFDNVDIDVILYDSNNGMLIVVKDFISHLEEAFASGDLSSMTIKGSKKVNTKTTFREITDTSAFV